MLAVRVIPCLDVDAGRVVKGVRFVEIRDAGDPVELAARYDAEGADELVFLDITASADDRDTMLHVVEQVAEQEALPARVARQPSSDLVRDTGERDVVLVDGALGELVVAVPALLADEPGHLQLVAVGRDLGSQQVRVDAIEVRVGGHERRDAFDRKGHTGRGRRK